MNEDLWSVELGHGIGVIKLGETRDEVLQRLAGAGIKLEMDDDEDDDDLRWLYVGEMDTELTFTKTKPPLIREIVVEDERLRFGPMPVLGQRLHTIVELLQVPNSETLWRIESYDEDNQPADGKAPPAVMEDEELLNYGTLWIPSLGLGLGMVRGEITTVRLRKPEGSPKRGIGTLTPSQRELSSRKDLPTYLVRPSSTNSTPYNWFQTLAILAVAVALGLLVWRSFDYQRRWNAAPVVEGEVIDVKPPPPDPFPDEFTITYRDQAGTEHQVVLRPSDLYVTQKVGEKVELRYLPEAPGQPLGPARYRDIAFEKFVPWAIGIIATYLGLQVVIAVAGLVAASRSARPANIS